MVVAAVVPVATGWDVRAGFGPLSAHWDPRLTRGSIAAVALALGALLHAQRLGSLLSWRRLLAAAWLASTGWVLSLALVDGSAGLATRADTTDYMTAARGVTDVSALLPHFVSRIPIDAPSSWPVHVAGHPPGTLLFFLLLQRIGLGDPAVGLVLALLAATAPVAVLVTLRVLGAEDAARAAAPFLVFAPAAVWEAVSGDAAFMSLSCWALTCLAIGAARRSIVWSMVAGGLLGGCVLMSYGLVLLVLLVLAITVSTRSLRQLPWVAGTFTVVVAGFAVAGYSLFAAYPALRQRYWDGIAADRPASYWLWGNLAALCFSAGPVLGAAVACAISRRRVVWARSTTGRGATGSAALALGGAAILAVLAADVSRMSKAEVERIWLPFIPWLLVLTALLPPRWRRPLLGVQLLTALLVQHLLRTIW